MIYSSALFVFFAIFVVGVFHLLSSKWKVPWLVLASFYWYASWEWQWAVVLFSILSVNYAVLWWLANRGNERWRRLGDVLLALDILVFLVLKWGKIGEFEFTTPYGTSFFMFILFAFLIDLKRAGSLSQFTDPGRFLLQGSFFPVLVGGPIERAKTFQPQLHKDLKFRWGDVLGGVILFAYGFIKIALLSSTFLIFKSRSALFAQDNMLWFVFLGIISTLQAYVDFSSYCDMGRGVARCLGIQLSVNFRPFYYAKNPSDFWQRWNISLGLWIRDYISFPMMLRWGRSVSQSLILFVSFVIVGLWHGLTANWLYFGIFNGFMVISYTWLSRRLRWKGAGYFFSFLIFIGNGLLQQPETLQSLATACGKFTWQSLTWFSEQQFAFPVSPWFFPVLAGMFLLEGMLEFRPRWMSHLQKNLGVKIVLAALLILLFFFALDRNILVEQNHLPPAYFRI